MCRAWDRARDSGRVYTKNVGLSSSRSLFSEISLTFQQLGWPQTQSSGFLHQEDYWVSIEVFATPQNIGFSLPLSPNPIKISPSHNVTALF